jgi:ribosomal protein S18 acetylase RimI-like enzyme
MAHAQPFPGLSAVRTLIHATNNPFVIRESREADQNQAARLYRDGLMTGQLDPFDSATDLQHMMEVYAHRPPNRFWVAETADRIIGMLGLLQEEEGVGHMRRLRVDPTWQSDYRVAVGLMQVAAGYARERGFLKLVLHTPVDDRWAIPLLRRLGLAFARKRDIHGRQVIEFYVNFYVIPRLIEDLVNAASKPA